MTYEFFKYQGTGNDFIMFDARSSEIKLTAVQISRICERRFGIGADGVIILRDKPGYDFEMDYYNADGSQSMCGNGGRCSVKFAHALGIHRSLYHFLAIDGQHTATMADRGWVNLKMKDVHGITKHFADSVVNTGSPHYIKPVTDLKDYEVVRVGRLIRNSEEYITEGINVNFVEDEERDIFVRTYERGVENETLSCGTGVTAAALVNAHNDNGFNRIEIRTLGGRLAVEFDKMGEEDFENIWLCGPAEFVFKGEVIIE
ncbi:MAG TPA: diaminopimelate epimerase [Chitinophagaceae bacterium]|jgi:diaminopimelate epimerase|nr:diaminopimelate epimerase [Chitinophagaceae bacterium]